MTNQNNNNTLAQNDINKSFAAFADLEHQTDSGETIAVNSDVTFGEFAQDSSVFPMI